MQVAAPPGSPRHELKVVGLICAAHFISHFHLLLLPPLFPLLRDFYGVGFTELGFTIAVLNMTTGLTQVPFGFLVDRYGARKILIGATFVESAAIALIGVFPSYSALIALIAVVGVANAVYHPADYVMLNASVDRTYMGRAFSFHTFSGNFGDAIAPVTILLLTSLIGWRAAMFACGAFGLLIGALLWSNSGILRGASRARSAPFHGAGHRTGVALLFSLPILMGTLFYVGITMTGSGIKAFSVSTLHELYQTPLGSATVVLSAFLFSTPFGVLAGGFAADRISRHDLAAAFCFVCVAICIAAVAAFDPPLFGIGVIFAVAGFCTGFVAPQRDMMIRSITPPGQMGKVFAFVSTGFNVGGVIAPLIYGWVLDHSDARNIFWATAVLALLTMVTVLVTGMERRRVTAQG